MKKIFRKTMIYIVGLALLVLGYLYLVNWSIYSRIQAAGLPAADTKYSYSVGDGNASSGSLVYAVLGDSLTSGVGVQSYEESYPYLVATKLSQQRGVRVNLKTYACSGARTRDLIEGFLDPAIAAQPDIVTLLIGTNDIHGRVGLETFGENYEYILERLTRETSAKIYLVGLPNIGSGGLLLPPYNYYFARQTDSYNGVVKSLAEKYDLYFIDLNGATSSQSRENGYYAKDSFHPSAEGYRLWAQIIYDNFDK